MLWTLDLDDSLLEGFKKLQYKYVVPVITLVYLVEVRKAIYFKFKFPLAFN